MKRIVLSCFAFGLLAMPAHAAGGFSCESDEKDPVKLEVGGATPRSEPGLLNFGAIAQFDGRKIEFTKSDVKGFTGQDGTIQLRASARSGEQVYMLRMTAKRNPKDEDDWSGTYELAYGPAAKPNATIKRGNVNCVVE